MANLQNALQELREERKQVQLQVEKLNQAILVIESLDGSGASRGTSERKRIISAASRQKMAQAQKARWAKIRKESQPVGAASMTASRGARRKMSAAARRKIAAFQRARWAKLKAQQQRKAA